VFPVRYGLYLCSVRFSQQTATVSPHSIIRLGSVAENDVSCEVRTGILFNSFRRTFSSCPNASTCLTRARVWRCCAGCRLSPLQVQCLTAQCSSFKGLMASVRWAMPLALVLTYATMGIMRLLIRLHLAGELGPLMARPVRVRARRSAYFTTPRSLLFPQIN
jgi:hypothetical protein